MIFYMIIKTTQNFLNKIKIHKDLLQKDIYENIEQYVKNIMKNNFYHENHDNIYTYVNSNDKVQIKKSNEYTIIFDNMQCNMKNIINIQMMLSCSKLKIYIPFILCCENINVNKKDNLNDDNNYNYDDLNEIENNVGNIIDSYNKLKNKINKSSAITIIESDFYDNNGNLKNEYIYESLLIGFNYDKKKLLNFKNINSFNNMNNKTKELLNDFIDYIKLLNNTNNSVNEDLLKFKQIIKNITINEIEKVIKYKKSKNKQGEKELSIFNKIKAIIYSMKEMRDLFYIKEIVKRTNDGLLNINTIYCTSDSINLFRSILYNISTINLHNNNIKYISIYQTNNNKKYVIYKQISPSYYYKFNENYNVKFNMFYEIDKLSTTILKKEIIMKCGSLTQTIVNKTNLKTKKYIIKCIHMDYKKLRFELQNIFSSLSWYFNVICDDKELFISLKNNNFETITIFSKHVYKYINALHTLAQDYKLDDFQCIDFNCNDFCDNENKYFNGEIDSEIDIEIDSEIDNEIDFNYNKYEYMEKIHKIKSIFIDNIDIIKNKVINSKFYGDNSYKLTNKELNFTVLLYYNVWTACEITEREKLGYVLKMLLNEYDYKLFRNALNLYYDVDMGYSDYIKGKFKFVETFDEDKYEYITKLVHNEFYPDDFDLKPVEYFERKDIDSKYKSIQKYIIEQNI